MTIREHLIKVRELLSDPTHWCKDAWARDATGVAVGEELPEACSFCISGAINVVALKNGINSDATRRHLRWFLDPKWQGSFWNFNDSPLTTHEQVLELLDKAIVACGD